MRRWWLMACVAGCGSSGSDGGDDDDDETAPIVAPTELADLAGYLFRTLDLPDERAAGVAEVRAQLGGLSSAELDLEPLSERVAEVVERPDRDLSDLIGLALVHPTDFAPLDHAAHVVLDDQTPLLPDDVDRYDRDVVEGDADEVASGTGRAVFIDRIEVSSAFVRRDDRIDTVAVWEGDVLLVRSSLPEADEDCSALLCVYQSYTLDVYAPEGRFAATWDEAVSDGLEDDLIAEARRQGLDETLAAEEAWLAR